MAGLQKRGESYRVIFRFHGKQYTLNLGEVSDAEAESKAKNVSYLLMRLKQGLKELLPGDDIVSFLERDGEAPSTPVPPTPTPGRTLVLSDLRDRYLATYAQANESNTLKTAKTHFRHLAATLGPKFPLHELEASHLQQHIDCRAKAFISPVTIRKEIATLGTAWKWAERTKVILGSYPNEGLVYPRADEKPPFQTREEIERQIGRGALCAEEQDALWECLFLTLPDIAALLEHVREHARHTWIYPMVCFAAHTGARRSELLRARVADLDFESETVLIREKKRQKGRRTTRRVPLSPFLADLLKAWLIDHPGGAHLFCHSNEVRHSRKRSRTTGHKGTGRRDTSLKGRLEGIRVRTLQQVTPLTETEAHDHLKRTLRGSQWEVLRGWHVVRHSFISCCVAAGVDQRRIDEWVGHTTEDMRKRYRHLIPSTQKLAIRSVFG
jgi:integrase